MCIEILSIGSTLAMLTRISRLARLSVRFSDPTSTAADQPPCYGDFAPWQLFANVIAV